MKISIPRDVLAGAVGWTARAIAPRPPVPVLAGLLLDAGNNGLAMSGFDYDISRRTLADAEVAESGRVLLPGRVLVEVVKHLPAGEVDLTLDRAEVVIRSGRSEFALPTLPEDDYPILPDLPAPVGTIDAQALSRAVGQVVSATSNDGTVPMLTGIRADLTADSITLAATDRYRIACTSVPWQRSDHDAPGGVVIPGSVLADMVKGAQGQASIHLSDRLLAVAIEDRTTTARLLDDQFIDYKSRLGAEGYTTWAEVELGPLVEAVKRVGLMAERHTPVRLDFRSGDVVVQAGGEGGRGTELVDGVQLDGDAFEIAFQPHYLLDGLTGVSGDRARIGMTGPGRPALIAPTDLEDPFRYLVMAVKLS